MDEVHTRLTEHQAYLEDGGRLEGRRLRQSLAAITRAIDERIDCRLQSIPGLDEALTRLADRVSQRELSPFAAADEVLKQSDL